MTKNKICVIGLGYVGLPLAAEFASKFSVVGFDIDEDRISLMMGKNCHLVIYPINKNKELNLVCIIRDKKYDPNKIKLLVNKVIDQNPSLQKVFNIDLKSWPLYSTSKILPSSNDHIS